jgi:hypothetical protein
MSNHASLLVPRHLPCRDGEHINIAERSQPTEDGRTVQIRTDQFVSEYVLQGREDPSDLLAIRLRQAKMFGQ